MSLKLADSALADGHGTADDKAASVDEKAASTEIGRDIDLSHAYTPEEEKRVLRKIDCVILPMVRLPNPLLQGRRGNPLTRLRCASSSSSNTSTSKALVMRQSSVWKPI